LAPGADVLATAAALRALELDCQEVLKGTMVDGVYSADPARDPRAVRFDRISFTEVLERGLGVMDAAAVALCREHGLPIRVFSMIEEGGLRGALLGEAVGTLVEPES
ncbi:MAG: UMP kinase, partial [Planctomycetota bacterium]